MEPGRTLNGRYTLLRLLGEGGMGAVYEARHTGTGRRVAVKQITGDIAKNSTLRARFEVEAKAAGQLETQHVAQVLDVDTDETGAPYIVMEYLAGEDLNHVLKRTGPLPPDLAVKLAIQACLGLEKAHDAGIVHRDIKPANIFLAERDSGDVVVKLLDFGIAKVTSADATSSTLTRSGSLLGSPLYMSPEQARGTKKLDHRSDIWSLGMVLYQMLAGATPYHHIDAMGELIITICSGPPPSVHDAAPWISDELAGVVARTLAFKPEDRYQSAGAMASALKELAPGGWSVHREAVAGLPDAERAALTGRTSTSAALTAPAIAGTPVTAQPTPRPPPGDIGAATTIRADRDEKPGHAGAASGDPSPAPSSSAGASSGLPPSGEPKSSEAVHDTRRDTTGGAAAAARPRSSRRAALALALALGGLAATGGVVMLRPPGGGADMATNAPVATAPALASAARETPAEGPSVVVAPAPSLASATASGAADTPPAAVASAAATASATAQVLAAKAAAKAAAAGTALPAASARPTAAATTTGTKPKGKGDDVWGRE